MSKGPVIYEVNLEVQPEIAANFARWLDAHIKDMLTLPGFVGAKTYAVTETEHPTFCVHYQLVDRAALEAYFQTDAERMRADGLKRFGDAMTASRRILLTQTPG